MSNTKDVLVRKAVSPELSGSVESMVPGSISGTGRVLYLVKVDDPSMEHPLRIWGTQQLERTPSYLEIVGYDLTDQTIDQLRTYDDVLHLANQEKLKIIKMIFPWHRVINIRNVSFSFKSKSV